MASGLATDEKENEMSTKNRKPVSLGKVREEVASLKDPQARKLARKWLARRGGKRPTGKGFSNEEKRELGLLYRQGLSYRVIEAVAGLVARNGNNAYDAINSVAKARATKAKPKATKAKAPKPVKAPKAKASKVAKPALQATAQEAIQKVAAQVEQAIVAPTVAVTPPPAPVEAPKAPAAAVAEPVAAQ